MVFGVLRAIDLAASRAGRFPRGPWDDLGYGQICAFSFWAPSVLRPIAYEDASPFRLESFTRLTQCRWA